MEIIMRRQSIMQDRRSPSRRATGHSENLGMELSGAVMFPGSSLAPGSPEAGKTRCVVYV